VSLLRFAERSINEGDALKVFAFGYSSGDGPMHEMRRSSLEYQSDMMLRALIADLSALPDIEVVTLRDPRAPAMDFPESVLVVPCDQPFDRCFSDCVQLADAVWPIAPESAGILERLSRKVLRRKRILLGSTPAAVHLASSKMLTARALANAGIPVVDTYLPGEVLPAKVDAWVVKPDDGAGCTDTRIFNDVEKALAWVEASGESGYVLQPFVPGRPCSLSLLCCNGVAQVLSCNEQRIAVRNNQFHYLGGTVNSIVDTTGECNRLAQKIAKAVPGLWGYIGIDFIMTNRGAVVLEVNPRLTTSYIGLCASIGCNPAGLVLGLLHGLAVTNLPAFKTDVVSVDADMFSASY
jgi:predicted ATP-grasp superfamily ATP-dependent carboligase